MKPRHAWAAALLCGVAVVAACAVWIRANPLPSYYDEALYAIYALIDVWAWRSYGAAGAWQALLHVDPYAPPGLRIVALPFTLLSTPSLPVLRAISMSGFVAAAAIAAAAVKRSAGATASALAFLFTMALPILVLACRMFGTEPPLLLAVALLLLGLTSRRAVWLFALSIACGLLAKSSYAVVALPMFLAAALLLPERRRAIAIGAPLGAAVALAWWANDPMKAIRFGIESGRFVRHSLGHNVFRDLYELLRCGFGFGIAAAVLIVAVLAWHRRAAWPPLALVCAAGAIPLLLLHAASVNNNPRLAAVPVWLIVLGASTLAAALGARAQRIVLLLAAVQAAVMVVPRARPDDGSYIWRGVSEVMAPVEQWTWAPLHRLADARHLTQPRIAMLGEGYAFNPPQIRYAWPERRGYVAVAQLYEWTAGKPFALGPAVERAATFDLVVTAAGYRGEATDGQVPNNAYNAQFAAALARDPRFEGPVRIDVGLRRPAIVQLFVRK